jgi:predicted DNA-binding transcriptional regulator AlpA
VSCDPVFDAKEAASYLAVTTQTLQAMRDAGEGPKYFRLRDTPRSRIRYRQSDLDAWVAERVKSNS